MARTGSRIFLIVAGVIAALVAGSGAWIGLGPVLMMILAIGAVTCLYIGING